jgi:putative salt-induced outer membrane protein YdiY
VLLQGHDDTVATNLSDVVFLRSVKEDFWSRASASVDFGYSFTKANALQQFSMRSSLGYTTDRWSASATYNRVNSTQTDVDDIQRTDLGAGFRWALPKNFYGGFDASFLSNTEQKLFLRSSYQPTVGNYLIRTNSMYLLVMGGAAYTREIYSTEDPERNTAEAVAGVELNLFDVGDVSLFISAKVFPGLSGSGRLRMDDRVDLKYDLPMDLYIRMGLTLNYDNQPVEGATDTDYVFQTTLGWEL